MAALKNEKLTFQELTTEEKQRRGILGRLYGPCADVIHATRNGRKYSEKLWEKVFSDPLVLEMIEKGGIPGELDHPVDRQEICSEKIAIMMPEVPKKNDQGQLMAYFDILDTPNGRIAYTLAKYGFKLGVSSRGTGDVYEDYDGQESVDPETYTFNCFDLVLCPSVKTARLALQESLGSKTFKQALNESLEAANPSDKKIMLESLQALKIDYKMQAAKQAVSSNKINESVAPKTQVTSAEDNGESLVKELQRQIRVNKELTESLATAQEKLSVCYAKEAKYQATIDKMKQRNDTVKEFETKIETLTEKLEKRDETIRNMRRRLSSLSESSSEAEANKQQLTESVSRQKVEIANLNASLEQEKQNSEREVARLTESIETLKKDKAIKVKECNEKLTKAKALVEKYKNVVANTLDRYIEAKARMIGVKADQVKARLTEGYSFEEIDQVCESLQSYQVTMSRLPFSPDTTKPVKMKVTESVEPIRPKKWFDDDVDDSLLRLAGLDN